MVDRLVNSEINNQRVSHVEQSFGSSGQPLRENGRVLVGEGVLTKLCRKKPKLRQFFLFNDILVYGSILISKKKYNKQHIIPLKDIRIEEIPDNETLVSPDYNGDGDILRNGWLIISPTKSFAVYAQTANEKQEWMSHMKRGINEQRTKAGITTESSDVAPTWVPDGETNQCMRCRKGKFTTLNRRHHCRKCGFVVCNGCSTKRAVIPYQSSKPIRVCDSCYDSIQGNPNSIERVSRTEELTYNGDHTREDSPARVGHMKSYIDTDSDSDADVGSSTHM